MAWHRAGFEKCRRTRMRARARVLSQIVIFSAVFAMTGCSSCIGGGVQGTYTDSTGTYVLELKSGGKASFTMLGQTADCTYDTSGDKISLECKGTQGKMVFTQHEKGILTPPSPFMPGLKKQ